MTNEQTVLSDDEKDAIYNAWQDRRDEASYGDLIDDVERAVLAHLPAASEADAGITDHTQYLADSVTRVHWRGSIHTLLIAASEAGAVPVAWIHPADYTDNAYAVPDVHVGKDRPSGDAWQPLYDHPAPVEAGAYHDVCAALGEANAQLADLLVQPVRIPLGWRIGRADDGTFIHSPSGHSGCVFDNDKSPLAEVVRQLCRSFATPSDAPVQQEKQRCAADDHCDSRNGECPSCDPAPAAQDKPKGFVEKWTEAIKSLPMGGGAPGAQGDERITRFNPFPGLGMNPHSNGLYIRYEDHRAALARHQTQQGDEQSASSIAIDALNQCTDALLHDGVPVDMAHPKRQAIVAADVARAALTSADEDEYTIQRMGQLLAEIAIALKGPEKERHRHGYQDLPELVSKMAIELAVYREGQTGARDALTYEHQHALKEAACNAAHGEYFDARKDSEFRISRYVAFDAGFARGWDAARAQRAGKGNDRA